MPVLNVRNAHASDMSQVVLIKNIAWVHAYKGIMSDDFLFQKTAASAMAVTVEKWQKMLENSANETIFLVAENERGEVVGFVFGGKEVHPNLKTDMELYALYVHPAVHGMGVGRKLLCAFAYNVSQNGSKTFGVGCLSANKSLAFYKHIGGKILFEINNPHFENLSETFLEYQIEKLLETDK